MASSELRRDPFTGDWVVLAPGRDGRPHQTTTAPRISTDPRCPFCPGQERLTPTELWRSSTPNGTWAVRVVPNLYPVVTPSDREARHHRDGMFGRTDSFGSHEVVIESPRHDWDLPDGTDDEAAAVLRAYRKRSRALQTRRPGVVLPFRNHSAEAGTSLPHPHSQIVATPVVPLRQRQLFDVARSYHDAHGGCLYTNVVDAELADGRRVVEATDQVVAFAPYASRAPYETWLVPRVHRASLTEASDDVLDQMAAMLRRLLAALRRAIGDVPYNYVVLSAPNGDENADYFTWHIQVLPRLTTAGGFELGTGMAVVSVPPEDAATELSAAMQILQRLKEGSTSWLPPLEPRA